MAYFFPLRKMLRPRMSVVFSRIINSYCQNEIQMPINMVTVCLCKLLSDPPCHPLNRTCLGYFNKTLSQNLSDQHFQLPQQIREKKLFLQLHFLPSMHVQSCPQKPPGIVLSKMYHRISPHQRKTCIQSAGLNTALLLSNQHFFAR